MKPEDKIEIIEIKETEDLIIEEEDLCEISTPSRFKNIYSSVKRNIALFVIGLFCFCLFFLFNFSSFYPIQTESKPPLHNKAIFKESENPSALSEPLFVKEEWILEKDMLEIITSDSQEISISWDVIKQVEDILSWSIGLKNLIKGDTITILWQFSAQKDSTQAAIAAIIINTASSELPIFAFKFNKDNQPAFYDWDGHPWKRKFLRSPVKYGRISSRYNLSRINPVLQVITAHKGTDFAAPKGTDIYALADGIISKRSFGKYNGNYIKIQHDSIYSTAYLHLSSFNKKVKKGDRVKQGQIIGYVGSTGSSTGPHVCLRFYRRDFQDDFIGAFPYLPKPKRLPLEDFSKYKQQRDSLMLYLEESD